VGGMDVGDPRIGMGRIRLRFAGLTANGTGPHSGTSHDGGSKCSLFDFDSPVDRTGAEWTLASRESG